MTMNTENCSTDTPGGRAAAEAKAIDEATPITPQRVHCEVREHYDILHGLEFYWSNRQVSRNWGADPYILAMLDAAADMYHGTMYAYTALLKYLDAQERKDQP
jgi:hypothetical protein